MPAVSQAQRAAIAIAENNPDKLYKRNQGMLSMKAADMHDFVATHTKNLPIHVPKVSTKTVGAKLPAVGKTRKYYGEEKI
jgi:hypothetical protein